MSSTRAVLGATAALLIAAPHRPLAAQQQQQKSYTTEVSAPRDAAMAMLPMATSSAEARRHATLGQRELDMSRPVEALRHFQEAAAADPSSVFAQLGIANASPGLAGYQAGLDAAAKLAPGGSRAEQLEVAIAQKALVNDFAGAEASARELIAAVPQNPRAYTQLAAVQQQAGKETEARATLQRAIALAPDFFPAHFQLAYSYMTTQPTDPARAKASIERMVAIEPREATAFIAQGSYYRAMNQLAQARDAYTRAAALAPTEALPVQQRGHVESFLGNYDAARADYDAAMKLAKGNNVATFAMFRAFVPAYSGHPEQSIAELDELVGRIDAMGLPDPDGAKLATLNAETQIAIQIGDTAAAARAIAQRTPLVLAQAAKGSEEFRRLAPANVDYWDGLLAARTGDAAAARAKAEDILRIVAPSANPQKDQPAHAILGVLALEQKDYATAERELAQANQNDMFVVYERALALDASGKSAEAKALFAKIARYNFNGPAQAVARADAAKRAM